jgi:glycosyltransferase involved in cell wall biosynthesis
MGRALDISVVTPVYNTAQYPGECIESVLRQTYSNLECRIVNNRSSDGSREIALNTLEGTCGFEWWIMNRSSLN